MMVLENETIKNVFIRLTNLANSLDNKVNTALKKVADYGSKQAKSNLASYKSEFKSYPTELESSIYSQKVGDLHYQVVAPSPLIYIEYGTGVVGQNNSHPNASAKNVKYDCNQHSENGRIYPKKDGSLDITSGQSSKPFMFKTLNDMEVNSSAIIKNYLEGNND